jgi:hypothetical protein
MIDWCLISGVTGNNLVNPNSYGWHTPTIVLLFLSVNVSRSSRLNYDVFTCHWSKKHMTYLDSISIIRIDGMLDGKQFERKNQDPTLKVNEN